MATVSLPSGTIATDRAMHLMGKVLLTGGAGFLGRALLRRAHTEQWPCQFVVYSRDEEKQWRISSKYPDVRCILGDVRDSHNLYLAMRGQDVVIHAAAVKFIPEAEHNVMETVKTNIEGSRNVARAAVRAAVEHVIGISSDKAVRPCNVYGMTKAVMERMFSEANSWSGTTFSLVRYGNVVGSTGSIIPVFHQQLAELGHVRVTDPNMTRFWLSADEAVDIILLAAAQGHQQRGCIFVPRCGAMRIGDLATLLSNGAPIDIIGPRVGEKQHEDLIHYQEATRTNLLADYYIVHPATSEVIGDAKHMSYSSHSPARWIKPAEMEIMINDAATI